MAKHEEVQPGPDDFRPTSDVQKPEPLVSRRNFIKRSVQLAVAGALIPGALAQLLPAVAPDALGGGGAGPVILRDRATGTKNPVTIDHPDLQGPAPRFVTAEWNFLPATIYKVKKSILEASSKIRGYNTAQFAVQHPTEPEHALIVYRAKCKHLGCTVGFNAGLGGSKDVPDYDEDGANDGRILCPCHQGQYDIYDLARNVPGTPPPAPLDVIRFTIAASYSGNPAAGLPPASNAIVGAEVLEQPSYKAANLDKGSGYALGSMAATLDGA